MYDYKIFLQKERIKIVKYHCIFVIALVDSLIFFLTREIIKLLNEINVELININRINITWNIIDFIEKKIL